MAFFDEYIETMPQEKIREIQLQKFKKQVRHIFENNAFMRKRLLETGAVPEDIKSWEDIKKVLFTHKKDLRDNYPLGLLSGNWEDVVHIHMTSGPARGFYSDGL